MYWNIGRDRQWRNGNGRSKGDGDRKMMLGGKGRLSDAVCACVCGEKEGGRDKFGHSFHDRLWDEMGWDESQRLPWQAFPLPFLVMQRRQMPSSLHPSLEDSTFIFLSTKTVCVWRRRLGGGRGLTKAREEKGSISLSFFPPLCQQRTARNCTTTTVEVLKKKVEYKDKQGFLNNATAKCDLNLRLAHHLPDCITPNSSPNTI